MMMIVVLFNMVIVEQDIINHIAQLKELIQSIFALISKSVTRIAYVIYF